MHRLVEFSLHNRFLILVMALVVVGVGLWSMLALPVDAVPDITPNQVLILTSAGGLGPARPEAGSPPAHSRQRGA